MKAKCTSVWILMGMALVWATGCGSASSFKPDAETRYLKHNAHYQQRPDGNVGSTVNWTDCANHAMIPYNTAVQIGKSGLGFAIREVKSGNVVAYEFKSKYHGGISAEECIELWISDQPVSYPDLSTADQQGISAGKALVGMTKTGVRVALGYPSQGATPSLDEDTWYYWKGRANRLAVHFKDGVVSAIDE